MNEIYLDYCWSLDAYWKTVLNDKFYNVALKWMGEELLIRNGFILLPLQPNFLIGILSAEKELAPLFHVQFINAESGNEHHLVKATNNLSSDVMHRLGKVPHQESTYTCSWQEISSQLTGSEANGFNKYLSTIFHEKISFGSVFIKLQRNNYVNFCQKKFSFGAEARVYEKKMNVACI